MSHQLKSQWKEAKGLLFSNDIKIPKDKKFERLKTTLGFRAKISVLFDQLDEALDGGDLEGARKAFDQLKPKAETFLKLADGAKKELMESDQAKAVIMDKVIKSVQGLLMVARSDLVKLKDKAGESKELDAKKLAEWETKLAAMSKLVGDTVLKDLGSIIVSADGINELMKKLSADLPKADPKKKEQIAKQVAKSRAEWMSESARLKAVDAKAKQLLPALAAYADRKGMEKLGKDNKTLATARGRAAEAEDFIKTAKVHLAAAQREMAQVLLQTEN